MPCQLWIWCRQQQTLKRQKTLVPKECGDQIICRKIARRKRSWLLVTLDLHRQYKGPIAFIKVIRKTPHLADALIYARANITCHGHLRWGKKALLKRTQFNTKAYGGRPLPTGMLSYYSLIAAINRSASALAAFEWSKSLDPVGKFMRNTVIYWSPCPFCLAGDWCPAQAARGMRIWRTLGEKSRIHQQLQRPSVIELKKQ